MQQHKGIRNFLPLSFVENSPNFKWWIYITASLGTFIAVSDQSSTAIVTPVIAKQFGVDIPTVQWLAIGYMLSVSIFMMPAAAIANKIGYKNAWLIGFSLFGIAAFLTATGLTFETVLAGKILMGVGASTIQANGIAMIVSSFEDEERGKALGLHMTVVGLGAVGGPILGGSIESLLGWQFMFLMIAIFSLFSTIVAILTIPNRSSKRFNIKGKDGKDKLDWGGIIFSGLFLLVLILVITFVDKLGWVSFSFSRAFLTYNVSVPLETISGFSLAIFFLGCFLFWEKRTPYPMLPLFLFKKLAFSLGSIERFLCFTAQTATVFLMPFFLVSGLGMSTAQAMLYLLPSPILLIILGPITGNLSDKIGTVKPAFIGTVIAAIGMFVFSTVNLEMNPLIIAFGSGLTGLGMITFVAPNTSAIMGSASRDYYGIISAFMNLLRNGGHIVGIALPTLILIIVMGSLGYNADMSDPDIINNIGLREAYAVGMRKSFQVSAIIMVVVSILILIPTQKPKILKNEN